MTDPYELCIWCHCRPCRCVDKDRRRRELHSEGLAEARSDYLHMKQASANKGRADTYVPRRMRDPRGKVRRDAPE